MDPTPAYAITALNTLSLHGEKPRSIGQAISELYKKNEEVDIEFADCFILLLDAARKEGLFAKDILKAIVNKMEINKARKWGKPDENGVMEHIRNNHEEKTSL